MNSFKATVTIHGKIECITGLHIGGAGGGYEIGGTDNPVIRNPRDGYPYIPGSSLKGKMRALVEWAKGKVTSDGSVYHSNDVDDPIARIFGVAAGVKDDEGRKERKAGPSRLIVRDAVPDSWTRAQMDKLEIEQGLPKVEIKTEVNINRITSKPPFGPRSIERVPVGSLFDFEIVYAIYEVDGLQVKDVDLLEEVFTALRLVEDSALGGSGSRGSGQVRFHLGAPLVRTLDDYINGVEKSKTPASDAPLSDFTPLSKFGPAEIAGIKERLR